MEYIQKNVQKKWQKQYRNLDPNNADSFQGVAFFCILVHEKPYVFEVHAEVSGMSRHEIKLLYTDRVFQELKKLVK